MAKFSPEARDFFQRSQERQELQSTRSQPPAPESAEGRSPSEETWRDQEALLNAQAELRKSFAETTGADPAEFIGSRNPDEIGAVGAPFLAGLHKKYHGTRLATMVAVLLGALVTPIAAEAGGLRARLEAFDQRHEDKEDFERQQWKYYTTILQRAVPGSSWEADYAGHALPAWRLKIPVSSGYQPYQNWTRGRVVGNKLLPGLRQEKTQPYAMAVPPPNLSDGERLLLTTGYLDYVKEEGDSNVYLVFSPGGWLSINELQDQQARLALGPGEYRLYPHGSKSSPNEFGGTVPSLKPEGETYEKFWKAQSHSLPAPLQKQPKR